MLRVNAGSRITYRQQQQTVNHLTQAFNGLIEAFNAELPPSKRFEKMEIKPIRSNGREDPPIR